jgi:hypothetical protein
LSNDVPFVITYVKTNFGFAIDVKIRNDVEIRNDYYYVNGTQPIHAQAYQVNNIPQTLEIIPGDSTTQNLFDLLFTNENDLPNKTCNITTALNVVGNNPPTSIVFNLTCPLSYNASVSSNPPDYVDPNVDFIYFVLCSDQNKALLARNFVKDPFDGSHNVVSTAAETNIFLMYANVPFQSYYAPRLFPLYVEVSTNLETENLTVDGYSASLLTRHFPLGADQGATSFFQTWDAPVMHHARSARHTIDGIRIKFESEKDKWSFFNLTFFLDIVFYETPEEEELPQFENQLFQIPTDDTMTSQLQQYSSSFSNPFPIQSSKQNSGILRVGSSRSGTLKRMKMG